MLSWGCLLPPESRGSGPEPPQLLKSSSGGRCDLPWDLPLETRELLAQAPRPEALPVGSARTALLCWAEALR